MLGETQKQFSLTRAASSTSGRAKSKFLSVKSKCDISASFAIAFRNWRRRKKVPLKQVAADLGLSVNTISLWETGMRFPSKRHLVKLVEYTSLPPCRLFCVMADECVPADCLLAMNEHSRGKLR